MPVSSLCRPGTPALRTHHTADTAAGVDQATARRATGANGFLRCGDLTYAGEASAVRIGAAESVRRLPGTQIRRCMKDFLRISMYIPPLQKEVTGAPGESILQEGNRPCQPEKNKRRQSRRGRQKLL